MKYRVILHGDDSEGYSTTVPDLAGVFSAGDTVAEALDQTRQAIELYAGYLLDKGR